MEICEHYSPTITSDVLTLSSFESDDDFNTAASSLCSELFKQASDPKTVLTNPVVVRHLRKIHNKATMRQQSPVFEEDPEDIKAQLSHKIDVYNRRVHQAFLRVNLQEDLSYFGAIKFYRGDSSDDAEFRLINLKDSDTIGDIMPSLKKDFDLKEEQRCTVREIIQGDEILLDATEKPLELAVNSSVPVCFQVHTPSVQNIELLKHLQGQNLSPKQHKKLMEKFNFDDDGRSSSSGYRAGSVSSKSSDGKFDSTTDSINSRNSHSRVSLSLSSDKKSSLNRKSESKKANTLDNRRQNDHTQNNFTFGLKPKVKKTRKSNGEAHRKSKKPIALDHSDRRGRDAKRSASARKLFSSIRKSARGRSASRERANSKSSINNVNYNSDNETELSSDIALPGILKLFGDAVTPGANYKSVLATQQSNSKELIKAALERYGVSKTQAKYFVLCEVVGRVNNDAQKNEKLSNHKENDKLDFSKANNFSEDYVRPLNDHEKPLMLQSLWKPLEGYARRFEIRQKSKVQEVNEKDTETRDVNAQAKRLIIQKSRLGKSNSTINAPVLPSPPSSDSESEENRVYERQQSKDETVGENAAVEIETPVQFSDHEIRPQSNWPYLMTLQGESILKGKSENLIHRINEEPFVLGGVYYSKSHPVDIKLLSINHCHCVINCKRNLNSNSNFDVSKTSDWKVTLNIVDKECPVSVNGAVVNQSLEITGGCIITIDDQYIFMLKDPTSDKKLTSSVRFSFGLEGHRNSAFTPVVYKKKKVFKTQICFEPVYSEQVLDAVFVAAQDIVGSRNELYCESSNTEKELSPAKFMCFCIEHACLNFTEDEKKDFLFKMVSKLQSIVLEITSAVSKLQNDEKIKDPDEGISYLLPYLKPVVFWMSNALEIFSFLQTDLESILQERVLMEKDLNDNENDELLDAVLSFQVSDDILAVLEEVVMYSFQQLVYYLTKTLYGALPSLLESNPFADARDDDSLLSREGNSRIIAIYESAKGLTRTFGVHGDIENQLFSYLFFFTSISLFNTLMSDESANMYYRWEKGVQIRGNLEEIETWACDHGFQEQSSMFLLKFSTLANLLATPRSQMLKCTWSNFRRDYKQLHPSQLRQILEKYVLPSSKTRPTAWIPDAVDLEESTEDQFVMESYENHPPLVLPTDGIQLNLENIPDEDWFLSLNDFVVAVGNGQSLGLTKKSDSGYHTLNRDQIDGKSRLDNEYNNNTSDVSSQASLTESEINNNIIVHEKVSSYIANYDETESIPSSVSISSYASSQATGKYSSSDVSKTVSASPVPIPRKNVTPVPSPRHFTTTSTNNKTSKVSSSNNKSVSDHTDDFTIKGFHSPERNVAQILLNNVSHKYGVDVDEMRKSVRSDGALSSSDESIQPASESKSNSKEGSPTKMQVLPLRKVKTKHSEINKSNDRRASDDDAVLSHEDPECEASHLMPNEVFVVDVLKGIDGLGLGLVDGMYTSLKVNGVFVRSLVPDGPAVKHLHMKHQEVIRCWLQDGRLNLGDRILAVNGQSLLTTNYRTAIKVLRNAGDKMRFLVGRCGQDVALKITSSSC